MDRRNFIENLITATAGFMILPPVASGRIWKPTKPKIELVTDVETILDLSKMRGKWHWIGEEELTRLGLKGYQADYVFLSEM
jgi:hypothetical protein